MTAENLVPPTYEGKTCFKSLLNVHANEILQYDDKYYTCTSSGWRMSTDEELLPPVLNGAFCVHNRNDDSVVTVDGKYYIC